MKQAQQLGMGYEKKDLLLVKLPNPPNVDGEFYGVGYYSDSGFIFGLITEDFIASCALRKIPFESEIDYLKASKIQVIGKIGDIRNP